MTAAREERTIISSMPDFFGRVAAAGRWGPFRVSETLYAGDAFLPWHRHEESYVTFVLAGPLLQQIQRDRWLAGADDFLRQAATALVVLHGMFGELRYEGLALVEVDFPGRVIGTSEFGLIFADERRRFRQSA